MPDPGLVSSKVRAYMEALSPQARAMVLRAARLSLERGDLGVPGEVLLRAAEGLEIDETGIAARRARQAAEVADLPSLSAGQPWRDRVDARFWAPVHPFIVDVPGPVKQTGRIARASIERITVWLARDVAGAEFSVAYAEDPVDPETAVGPCVQALRRAVGNRALAAIRDAEDDPKTWQRFVAHIGGEQVVADLRDLLQIFHRDEAIEALLAKLPYQITLLDVEEGGSVPGIVRDFIQAHGMDLGFVGAMLLSRMVQPHLLVVLAARMTGSSDARTIAAGRYGRLVDCLIAEMERNVAIARQEAGERMSRENIFAAIRDHHETHRQMLFAVEIDEVSGWHRRLGGIRKDFSEVLGRFLEAAPGLVRRALRVESLAGAFGGRFDQDTFEDADFAIRVFVEVRLAADSLALNELLTRTRKEIERTLELLTEKLFADLKSNSNFDRATLVEAVDGAIRLSRHVFGEEYAVLLKKNRDLFTQRQATRAAG